MAGDDDLLGGAEQTKTGGINQVGIIVFQGVILAIKKSSSTKENRKIAECV